MGWLGEGVDGGDGVGDGGSGLGVAGGGSGDGFGEGVGRVVGCGTDFVGALRDGAGAGRFGFTAAAGLLGGDVGLVVSPAAGTIT